MDLQSTKDSTLEDGITETPFSKLYDLLNRYRYTVAPTEKKVERANQAWTYEAANTQAILDLEAQQEALRTLKIKIQEAEAEVVVEIRKALETAKAREYKAA